MVRWPFFLLGLTAVAKDKGDWICNADGYWYEDGKKSAYPCGGKDGSKDASGKDSKDLEGSKDGEKGQQCNATDMLTADTQAALEGLQRSCIASETGSPSQGQRCWWTHVPDAVRNSESKVPLVIDMHGGGGCAAHQKMSSGFGPLSDSLGSFVVVWPQAAFADGESYWPGCGPECVTRTDERKAIWGTADEKAIHTWDDVGFLEQLIANVVKGETLIQPQGTLLRDKIDAERVYLAGFSMGCMMAHRFAVERSKLVAAVGCHGGEMNEVHDSRLDQTKASYSILPTPVFASIGTEDRFYSMAVQDWHNWAYWNGCTRNETRTELMTAKSTAQAKSGNEEGTTVRERLYSSCVAYSPELQTVLLEIVDAGHVSDSRMAEKAWSFMKQYRRPGALAALPAAVLEMGQEPSASTSPKGTSPSKTETSSGSSLRWGLPGALLVVLTL